MTMDMDGRRIQGRKRTFLTPAALVTRSEIFSSAVARLFARAGSIFISSVLDAVVVSLVGFVLIFASTVECLLLIVYSITHISVGAYYNESGLITQVEESFECRWLVLYREVESHSKMMMMDKIG